MTERVRTGEHADTTDAASQSTTTVRARIAIRFTACHTLSGSLRPFSPERHPRIDDWAELGEAIEAALMRG